MPCIPKPRNTEKEKSRRISDELKVEAKKYNSVIRLLLLGTGESGKTTIIKQMRIIHINGFSEEEKVSKIVNIKQNVHESIYTLVSSMNKIVPPTVLKNAISEESAKYILQLGPETPEVYTDDYYEHVKILWNDAGIQETFRRANEFQLIDSASHFLDRINVIQQENYIPSVQDMLFCRITTVAISQIEFTIMHHKQKVNFCMYDVGGQRGERRKWISVFEGICAILFLIAASDFDQTLREDGVTNRLQEGFKVFNDIFWSRFVRKAGKIVFLNKQDLLQQKIENGQKLEKFFPEFNHYKITERGVNPNDNYERAKFFIRDKLLEITRNKPDAETINILGVPITQQVADQPIYLHFTTATDTNNIKRVFNSVKDIILTINLENAGLSV